MRKPSPIGELEKLALVDLHYISNTTLLNWYEEIKWIELTDFNGIIPYKLWQRTVFKNAMSDYIDDITALDKFKLKRYKALIKRLERGSPDYKAVCELITCFLELMCEFLILQANTKIKLDFEKKHESEKQ